MPLQCSEQDGIFLLRYASARHYHPVHAAEPGLMMAKTFAHDSLNTVTRHR